jgi:hypothetical protein
MAVKKAKVPEKKVKRIKVTGFAPMAFKDYTITQKSSGRFEIVTKLGKNVNGDEKVKLLLEAKVLKGSFKKETAEAAPAAQ